MTADKDVYKGLVQPFSLPAREGFVRAVQTSPSLPDQEDPPSCYFHKFLIKNSF